MKIIFIFFIPCFWLLSEIVSQNTTPNFWQPDSSYKIPFVKTSRDFQERPDTITTEENALYSDIIENSLTKKGDDLRLACREFLQKYPDSEFRYQVLGALKKIVPKNLQLYGIERTIFPSGLPPAIFMVASGVATIKLSLYQIDFLKNIQQGYYIQFLRTTTNSTLLQQWEIQTTVGEENFAGKLAMPLLPPGCYAILAQEKDLRTELGFFVSDIALLAKHTDKISLLWFGRRDGVPLKKPISLYILADQQIIYEGKSTLDGLWSGRLPERYASVTFVGIHPEGDIAIVDATWYRYERALQRCYIYRDRPVYFPGQKISTKVFFRNFSPEKHQYLTFQEPIYISLQDSAWRTLVHQKIMPSEWGTYEFTYTLSSQAKTGRYCLRARGWCMGESYFFVVSPDAHGKEKKALDKKNILGDNPVSLALSQEQYRVGEEMKISLSCQTMPMPVLMTWEGDDLLGYCLIPQCPKEYSLALGVAPSFAPQIKMTAYKFLLDNIFATPKTITVLDNDKILEITTQNIDKPSQREVEIQVQSNAHLPVKAEILAHIAPDCVYEKGDWQASIDYFYHGSRYIDIQTFDSLDFAFFTDREFDCLQPGRRNLPGEHIAAPMDEMPEIDFPTLSQARFNALWESSLTTDSEGKARFSFSLLPEISRWRLTILAMDKQSRVGKKEIILECK